MIWYIVGILCMVAPFSITGLLHSIAAAREKDFEVSNLFAIYTLVLFGLLFGLGAGLCLRSYFV